MMELARNDFNHTFFMELKSSLLQPGRYGNKETGLSSKNAQQVSICGKKISKMNVIIKPSG
jgi:hypothetical protein